MMFNRFLYSLILNFKSYFFKSSAIFILFYFTLTVIMLLAIGNIKSNYLDFSSIGLETDYDLTGELLIVFLLVYGSVSYYRVAFMSQAHQKFYKTDLSYLTAAPDRKSGFLVFKLLQTFPKLCLVPVLTGLGIYIGITAMILCYMISIFLILYWLSNIIPKNVIKWSGPFTLFEKLLDKPTIVFLRLFIGFLFELL